MDIMRAQGWPPIGTMTARGAMKAAEIVGVKPGWAAGCPASSAHG
jgi:hypothetical protein